MKVLNLTDDFNPSGAYFDDMLKYELSMFPGGEPNFRLHSSWKIDAKITISIRVETWLDMGILASAVNAIKNAKGYSELHLQIPYFPGARQDRICNPGEALTVKVYADFINSMNFDSVLILDPHSDVTPALINNCNVMNNSDFIRAVDTNLSLEDLVIICQDAGEGKKIISLCKACGFDEMVKCDKERDLETGKLSGFTVYADDLKGKPCLIVDDICDGGGIFIGLADELKKKNAGDLYLAVSHGIFSKGEGPLSEVFKKVFTTDSFFKESDKTSDLIEIINLNTL
mgnify:CR=1 FL=1